jgi:hypothetical protein
MEFAGVLCTLKILYEFFIRIVAIVLIRRVKKELIARVRDSHFQPVFHMLPNLREHLSEVLRVFAHIVRV